MKEGGNVTVLAQLYIWHKSHTLPGSSICTVACLLCYCLVAYLAQVTHLARKFHLHCCLLAPLYPLPIRTSSASCCSLYHTVLTEYRIKGEMWKAGWFSQERSVKECEGVWWNMVVVTPDQ